MITDANILSMNLGTINTIKRLQQESHSFQDFTERVSSSLYVWFDRIFYLHILSSKYDSGMSIKLLVNKLCPLWIWMWLLFMENAAHHVFGTQRNLFSNNLNNLMSLFLLLSGYCLMTKSIAAYSKWDTDKKMSHDSNSNTM